MATKQELIDGYEFLIREARRIAASLSADDWTKAVDQDGWKNTQVLAHVAGIGTIVVPFVTGMSSAPAGTDAGAAMNIDELNAGIVAARAGKTPAELAEEVATAYGAVIEWVRGAPDDVLEKRATFSGYRDVLISDLLVRMTILHGLGHIYAAYSAVMDG
jgi:hypothetical protein